MREETCAGSDGVVITVGASPVEVVVRYQPAGPVLGPLNLYLPLGTHREIGAAVLPFGHAQECSTVLLPFKSDLLLSAEIRKTGVKCFRRVWQNWRWHDRTESHEVTLAENEGAYVFRIPRSLLGTSSKIDFVIYAKDPEANYGWGWFWGCSQPGATGGAGDKYIPHYHELSLDEGGASLLTRRGRYGTDRSRMRIYQLFVRLFGNTREDLKQNGSAIENGVGKFNDINDLALASLREMGFTHIWLTGVLQQITATDFSVIGKPADDPDLLKGLAGSPYAIKDYFDVSPDYAVNPAERLREFRSLIERLHGAGLKALIDFIPNHVARSYNSTTKPESNFGSRDDRSRFFDPRNNFFYLQLGEGPPLRLPTWRDGVALSPTCTIEGMQCDGLFAGELDHGRVTGNNVASWAPGLTDWYETVKLNYGFDFMDPSQITREYPSALAPDKPIPDTWRKMDEIVAYWQDFGIDGFRCDMAHMVPPEFWNWLIDRARRRAPEVIFIAEAYNNDPMKVPGSDPIISCLNGERGNIMFDLLNAGFNAVYDDPAYKAVKRIYDGAGWANDVDCSLGEDYIFDNSLRYAENHDEVRLAAPSQWGGHGMEIGRPVSALLYGMSRGPAMLYNGQEVGEPAQGVEGFGGDDARTSIFDYWAMPELRKWVNCHRYDGGQLSDEERQLRDFYGRLLQLVGEPAFRDGGFFPLNPSNRENPGYGRLPAETTSGHWLYAYLRYDTSSSQRFLVVASLHPTLTFREVRLWLGRDAWLFLNLAAEGVTLRDRLSEQTARLEQKPDSAIAAEIAIPVLAPLTASYFEFA